jgi:hypothetical protein
LLLLDQAHGVISLPATEVGFIYQLMTKQFDYKKEKNGKLEKRM